MGILGTLFDSYAQAMWVYGMAKALGRPAVYRTFNTNHFSYIKTLVPIYIFRAITFFRWCRHFLERKMAFLPQNKKNFVMSYFLRNLNCSSSISRYVLVYIWVLDYPKQIFWLGHYFRKYRIFCKKWVFKTWTKHSPSSIFHKLKHWCQCTDLWLILCFSGTTILLIKVTLFAKTLKTLS